MTSATCYHIIGGEVRKSIIPAAGLELPVSRRLDYRQPVAIRGAENADWAAYTLGQVTEVASRLVPWTVWYCSPGKVGDIDAEGWRTFGTAHTMQSAAWLSTAEIPTASIQSALHEAWHLAEDFLTLAEMEAVGDGIHSVPALPPVSAYAEYYSHPSEVRANAFMAWAFSYWLRGRMPQYHRGIPADEKVWTLIMRGDLGLRVARRRLIPADRMPKALRHRMNERGDSQKIFDGVRFGAVATLHATKAAWAWAADAFRSDAVAPVRGRATGKARAA